MTLSVEYDSLIESRIRFSTSLWLVKQVQFNICIVKKKTEKRILKLKSDVSCVNPRTTLKT